MSTPPPSVLGEPMFQSKPATKVTANEHEVWSEPGLMPGARPSNPSATYSSLISARWKTASEAGSWAITILLIAVAAPLALLSAFFKSGSLSIMIAIVIMAPLVEELGKALAPLMLLERQPYRFTSGLQPLLVCIFSGLVFAYIENQLYFHVYTADPSPSLIAWRSTVCVALHTGCSLISGLGLRQMWLAAHARQSKADITLAAPYLIAAMVIHGAYNALTVLLHVTGAISLN